MGTEQVDVDGRCRGHSPAVAGDFAHHAHRFGEPESRAAIFLGHGDAEPAAFRHRAVKLVGKFSVVIARQPIFVAEFAHNGLHAFADDFVVFVAGKIHVRVFLRSL